MVGDTHEAMSQAMKMVDVTKGLENELQTVATSTRLLEKDCISATENLSIKLARNKVCYYIFFHSLNQNLVNLLSLINRKTGMFSSSI